jgi:hypothetical protein
VTRKTYGICAVIALIGLTATIALAEGLDSNVVAIDQKKHQLSLDWMNDTTKVVQWNQETKFSVLETGAASKPAEIHVGSYLRIKGEERDGLFVATEVKIWLAESKPAPAPK